MSSVAIVGGGQAGATVAHTLRTQGFEGSVTLVCAENELPYERPPLSKGVLLGEEGVPVLPADYYGDKDIELRLGVRATRIGPGHSGLGIDLESGEGLTADAVVVATGSRPRGMNFPGRELDNVLTLGTMADARLIVSQLPELRRVVIVGAGFVGTEVAASLRTRGCEVTLVEPFAEPLGNKLGLWAARVVRQLHEAAGVTFVQDVVVAAQGDTRVTGVITGSGTSIECDLLLVAAGSEPNLEFALASGLSCNDGVICDEAGRTSMEGVWAAGDVASWPFGSLGRLRVEHYRTAIDQGQVVARGIAGDTTPSDLVPWFWTDQYQHRFEVAGRPDQGSIAIERRSPDGEIRLSVHLRGDQIVGAVGLDAPREIRAATNLIRGGTAVIPSLIEDSSIDLRKVAVPA